MDLEKAGLQLVPDFLFNIERFANIAKTKLPHLQFSIHENVLHVNREGLASEIFVVVHADRMLAQLYIGDYYCSITEFFIPSDKIYEDALITMLNAML